MREYWTREKQKRPDQFINWGLIPELYYFSEKPKNGTQRAYRKISQDRKWELTFDPAMQELGPYSLCHTELLVGACGKSENDAYIKLIEKIRQRMEIEKVMVEAHDEMMAHTEP